MSPALPPFVHRTVRPTMRPTTRPIVATVAALAVALGLALAPMPVAGAHVGIMSATTTGADTEVRFRFDHGCDGSPTTAMDIQLPTGATTVDSDLPTGWTLTGGDGTATLSGPPIPDDGDITFMLTITGHDTSVQHLVPVLQQCPDGELAWIDADGASAYPAPVLTATTSEPAPTTTSPTTTSPTTTTTDEPDTTAPTTTPNPTTDPAPNGSDTASGNAGAAGEGDTADAPDGTPSALIAGLVVAALAAGGGAMALARKRSAGPNR